MNDDAMKKANRIQVDKVFSTHAPDYFGLQFFLGKSVLSPYIKTDLNILKMIAFEIFNMH